SYNGFHRAFIPEIFKKDKTEKVEQSNNSGSE
ncbi:2,4-dienoyl-CoA reductase, partial [Acinetobacter baumannii]|nr:2,4-dienoyl-CoA reductase [Acinetobacter baumannii]